MEILIALLCIIGQIWIISDLPLAVKDKNKLLAGVFFLEFFILLGFRDISVLGDTDSYAYHFNKIFNKETPFYIIKKSDRFSYGYLLFEQFFYQEISSSFLCYNIVTTLLILGGTILFFYRNSLCLWLVLYLFVVTKLVFSEAIALRQGLGLVSLLIGFNSLFAKKYIRYICSVLVAMMFHSSAFIMLLVPLLYSDAINFKLKKYGLLLFSMFVFVFYEIVFVKYIDVGERYQGASEKNGFFSLIGLFNTLVAVITYLYVSYLEGCFCEKDKLIELHGFKLVTLFYLIFSVFSIRLFVFGRFTIYFLPLVIVYISFLYQHTVFNKNVRLITALYLFIQTISFLFIMYYRPEWTKILPYSFYQS